VKEGSNGSIWSNGKTLIEQRFPKDPASSNAAYSAALRAKVLDCLRGLLPAGALTNMGIYGNGRFFESLIHKLNCQNLAELQDIGKRTYEELEKVIPSFIRRANPTHRTHQDYSQYQDNIQSELKLIGEQHLPQCEKSLQSGVRLVSYDSEAVTKVAAALLFAQGDRGLPELWSYCKGLSDEELARILDAACNARENRR
jgi:thymidylate synthase ThyX